MREIEITLRIQIEDLSDEDRREAASDMECPAEDLPAVGDVGPDAFAQMLSCHLEADNPELWAGSDMYARITSVEVTHCQEILTKTD